MPTGPRQVALRTYQRAVANLVSKYGVSPLGRDPKLCDVAQFHHRLLKKVHPDKGGSAEDFRVVQAAKEALDNSVNAALPTARPPAAPPCPPPPTAPPQTPTRKRPASAAPVPKKTVALARVAPPCASTTCHSLMALSEDLCPFCAETSDATRRQFRIQSNGVLLTYNGEHLLEDDTWCAFKQWAHSHKKEWSVLYSCLTMELCRRRRRHLHMMLQFRSAIDAPSSRFAFRGILPNARPTWSDYCYQGRDKKNPQQGLNRGFFYVFANKIGTCQDVDGSLCVAGNCGPYWTDYPFLYEVLGDWPEKLWKRYQLTHKQYKEYLTLCRDRVPARMRNLEEVIKGEEALLDEEEIKENMERIRSNPDLYKPFKQFPVAQEWLRSFLRDALRYAIMLVRGFSRSGKTELAKSWFRNPLKLKVGRLVNVFPAKMRYYNRRFHDGIVLDDLRDLRFLVNFQHVFQGKPDEEVGFAENTEGGNCAYSKLVFATPFVATFNDSVDNEDLLQTDDFLSKPENRILLRLSEKPFQESGGKESGPTAATPSAVLPLADTSVAQEPNIMEQWTVSQAAEFLRQQDLCAASKICLQNDVSGADLAKMSRDDLQNGLRFSPFLAEKVVQAVQRFLSGQCAHAGPPV